MLCKRLLLVRKSKLTGGDELKQKPILLLSYQLYYYLISLVRSRMKSGLFQASPKIHKTVNQHVCP